MHQILILSGKGGTGKTTVASTFIALSHAKAYADCDVDAPNLHLVMGSFETEKKSDYFGLPKAEIDGTLCTACNRCYEVCRFDAVIPGPTYQIDPIACEGCTYCLHICPEEAIHTRPVKVGDLRLYERDDECFSTATLTMGSGTTGKLVSEVKKQLRDNSPETEVAILDGSPGIGCPVIASLSGVDLALMVAEPSVSAFADLKRVITSARQLQVPVAVVVNKYDMNPTISGEIEVFCFKEGIPFLGKIPYDKQVIASLNKGENLAYLNTPASHAIKQIYEKTLQVWKEQVRQ
jgi:MinD superfamily P-loop ATPase